MSNSNQISEHKSSCNNHILNGETLNTPRLPISKAHSKMTKSLLFRIISLYKNGKTLKEIRLILRIPSTTFNRWLCYNDNWLTKQLQSLTIDHLENLSLGNVSEILETSNNLKEKGLIARYILEKILFDRA